MVYSGLVAFIDILTKTLIVYGVFRLEIKNKKKNHYQFKKC